MALGSTQPLTEMSTRNFPGGKGRPAHKADNFTAICEPTVWKMWGPRRLTTLWTFTACYRDSFFYFYPYMPHACLLHSSRRICVRLCLLAVSSLKESQSGTCVHAARRDLQLNLNNLFLSYLLQQPLGQE
jgi:hypothetical protein